MRRNSSHRHGEDWVGPFVRSQPEAAKPAAAATSAEERRNRWGYHSWWVKARRTGTICGRCGTRMAALTAGAIGDHPDYGPALVCRGCADTTAPPEGVCESCGRPLTGTVLGGRLLCCERCRHRVERNHVCLGCGASFVTDYHRDRRYCSTSCYHRSWLRKYRRKGPYRVVCAGCGVEFPSTRPTARWCSSACRYTTTKGRKGPHQMVCAGCGADFTAKRSDARWCSSACRQRVTRARGKPEAEAAA